MAEPLNLIKLLAEVVQEVERVEKRGHNSFQDYDYVTESDMVDALRGALSKRGIISIPFVDKCDLMKLEKGILATIEISYRFTNGPESVIVRVVGSGTDNPGDKAVYKAMTGAEKYALKQLFLIPTGDDPERDEERPEASRPKRDNVQRGSTAQSGNSGSKNPPSEGVDRSVDRKVREPSVSSDEKDRTVAFGPNKGKTIDGLDDKDLASWTKVCEETVAKNDPRWGKINQKRLDACKAEWEKRQPWRSYYKQILEIGTKYNLDEDGVRKLLKEAMMIKSADELKEGDPELFEKWAQDEKGE